MKKIFLFVLGTAAIISSLSGCGSNSPTPPPTPSGWSYTNLHPTDYSYSVAGAVSSGGWIGGAAFKPTQKEYVSQPIIWKTPLAASATNIYDNKQIPAGIFAISNSMTGGFLANFGAYWPTSTADFPGMVPLESSALSVIYGLSNGWAVGSATELGTNPHTYPRLWDLTNSTKTDLTPASEAEARVWGIDGATASDPGFQVGEVSPSLHAALWKGTAGSFVDLHPAMVSGAPSLASAAWAVSGSQQGGYATTADDDHAALWSGKASSFVDLHPLKVTGVKNSYIRAMATGIQVGNILFSDDPTDSHAFLWYGAANTTLTCTPFYPQNSVTPQPWV